MLTAKLNTPPQTEPESPTQNKLSTPEVPQGYSKIRWCVIGGLVVLVLVVGLLYVIFKKSQNSSYTAQQSTAVQQPTMQAKPTISRSKVLGIITNVVTASSLDAQGNAASPTTTFAVTDKNIYLVLMVNKPKVGTKFEYIRYLNNKYLDSGTLKTTTPNITNTSFYWSLQKPGAKHLTGSYKVKVYTNGVFEREVSYMVQ